MGMRPIGWSDHAFYRSRPGESDCSRDANNNLARHRTLTVRILIGASLSEPVSPPHSRQAKYQASSTWFPNDKLALMVDDERSDKPFTVMDKSNPTRGLSI